MGDVGLDRGLAHMEALGDLGVAESARQFLQHLALPLCEGVQLLWLTYRRFRALGELFDQALRHRRSQERLARRDDANRLDQVVGARGLEQKARCTRGQRVEDVFVQLEGREDDDARHAHDFARRRDAIDFRHADVHQDYFGALAADQVDRLLTVGGFAHDLHVRLRLDDQAEAGAHHRLVVDDCDPDQLLIGSLARTVNPPSDDEPVFISPPKSSTRSRIPIRPWPLARPPLRPLPLSLIVSTIPAGSYAMSTSTRFALACLSTFVIASWTIL